MTDCHPRVAGTYWEDLAEYLAFYASSPAPLCAADGIAYYDCPAAIFLRPLAHSAKMSLAPAIAASA
jgi:hypothetical protein